MSDIIIVDEFFPKIQQRILELGTLEKNLEWLYVHSPATIDSKIDQDFIKNDEDIVSLNFGVFRHVLIYDAEITSPIYELHLSNIKTLIEKKFKVEVESIDRMFFNFATPTGTKTKKYGIPHYDSETPNTKILIYYINDSDGDTVIFDEFFNGEINSEKKTISQRIAPKKARAVMFDSNRYHAASWPSEVTRRVININFRIKV